VYAVVSKVWSVDVGVLLFLTVLFGFMFMLVQRAEAKRRLFVMLILLVVGELVRRYVYFRGVHTEAWIALVVALVVNFLFWLLIGRYNPVHSSEEIRVIGLDD
jgi:hypothetical protein